MRALANGAVDGRWGAAPDGTTAVDTGRAEVGAIPATEAVFVAKAAHELRGAVGGIDLLASALADRMDVGTDQDLVALVHQLATQAARVEVMAHQLLDLARFGEGRHRARCEPVSITGLVDLVLAAEPRRSDRVIVVDIDEDLVVDSDPVAIGQIMTNLIRNALRHGGEAVLLRAGIDGDHLAIEVADDGPGVPDHLRDRLFEPFVRGASGVGNGLGLTIVAELVHAMQGEIGYQSSELAGSTFWVRLPLG